MAILDGYRIQSKNILILGLPWTNPVPRIEEYIAPLQTRGYTELGDDLNLADTKLIGTTRDNMLNDVSDEKLTNVVRDLYRPNAKVGNGSSMDAYRYEKTFSTTVGGKTHQEKLLGYRSALLKLWHKRSTMDNKRTRSY
ncbi:MAG TPA: hypothetical protein VL098_08165 [Flavipsychrobacter sp.]|nr:hypothetical protein [Flavipsychrobacter sp.]